jgi:F0F1-type ATP synthase membrane subunit b/b'
MDTIQAIFAQLGADGSIAIQFAIVIAMFILTKFVFFEKLQFVIENREEKTVKLESSADETFEKVNELSEQYRSKIEAAQISAQSKVNDKRNEIINENNSKFKTIENEIEQYVENSRNEFKKEVQEKETEIFSQSDELANSLIQKLTN